ncbi:P pilus assembly protein, pilin FimA [Providencia rustigianii]|uniref:Fimbrial protein n=2 Tax=Providencia rustigianii TaxID=158850 RepID=D1P171_9GAMM|nr:MULTISPECIES: fimbrial protein [Providencia]EFB73090.1 fimbrial protein [Providencia rustigianii DSM 4541]MTC56823.1 fimbrial protein [Providencia rustigianii]MTC60536.1 fimbrial protein [Providencia rustigianii]SPY76034.1 P pilus assembly protein, pilin FimA [Providencia rustigianii]SUC25173.1 P pilus assembly protein, pilin FimA [Providencia rustigianii]
MNIKKVLKLLSVNAFIYFAGISSASAFTCRDTTGNVLSYTQSPATANAYVNLVPSVQTGQNLVVDLSQSISCRNDDPTGRKDLVSMTRGSAYGGVLTNFTGSLRYYGSSYPFPLNSATHQQNFNSGSFTPWNTQLYLTPVSAAGGVVLKKGTHFATLVMYQVGSDIPGGGNINTSTFTWNLYANNDVVVPTGGCDVSSRNVVVTLPEYPGSAQPVPISIHCASNQNISYYLSGATDTSTSIFANTLSGTNTATGIGIQILRNGTAISANQNVQLGRVGTSAVNLGLTTNYARTKGQVTAGKVQSVIGVTFMYD